MGKGQKSFTDFCEARRIDKDSVAFITWQQAMVQFRHLHDAVWRAVTFTLTINGVIIAGIAAIASKSPEGREFPSLLGCLFIAALAFAGIIFSKDARHVFDAHRRHYLNQAAIKTRLEMELGFYEFKPFQNCGDCPEDFSFQWRYSATDLVEDREHWQAKNFSPTDSAFNTLRGMFFWFWYAYGWALVLASAGAFCRAFQMLGCVSQ